MLFSIIIPIYNVENYLRECIDSVLVQDFQDYEIILVDDGSPDRCGEICDEYASKFPQIKVIHKQNGGLSDARNFGIKAAIGDYLVFLDSDDFWKGTHILSDVSEIINNENPDVVLHGHTELYADKTKKEFPRNKVPLSNDFIKNYETLTNQGIYETTGWNKIVRRDLVIKNGIEFPKGLLHEDAAWCFDIAQHIKNYSIYENPFYQYRLGREGAITNEIKDKNVISLIDILQIKTKYLLKHKESPLYKGNLRYLFSIYYICYRRYYRQLTEEHQKSASKHFYKLNGINSIYKGFFMTCFNRKKAKLMIKLFGIQKGIKLIELYFKYILKDEFRF